MNKTLDFIENKDPNGNHCIVSKQNEVSVNNLSIIMSLADLSPAEFLHCKMLELTSHKKFLDNLQAKFHVLDGRYGEFILNPKNIFEKVKRHFLYELGNIRNTPPESCLLVTTLMGLLCCKLDRIDVKRAASAFAKSAGAFNDLANKKPNRGVLLSAIKSAEDGSKLGQTTMISCTVVDLFVQSIPYPLSSIAHCFSVVLGPNNGGGISVRVYQAYGPPDIGCSIHTCLKSGSASEDMSEQKWEQFKKDFAFFESSKKWNPEVEKVYQSIFCCKQKMPRNYPVTLFTRVHSDVVVPDQVQSMFQILSCDY